MITRLALLFGLGISLSGAAPIAYTISGSGNGVVFNSPDLTNTTPFTDLPFSFSFFIDTSQVQTEGVPPFHGADTLGIQHATAQLGSASGSLAFSGTGYGLMSGFGSVSWYFNSSDVVLGMTDPSFAGYDLRTAIGPIYVQNAVVAAQNPLTATLGAEIIDASFFPFEFTSVSNVTFEASVSPEPATFTMFGFGFALVGSIVIVRGLRPSNRRSRQS